MKRTKCAGWVAMHLNASQAKAIASSPGLAAFRAALEGFEAYLLTEQNFSRNTSETYLSDLTLFLGWCADHGQHAAPEDLDAALVRRFLAGAKAWSPATRARRVAALKHFVRYSIRYSIRIGRLSGDPLIGLSTGRQPKHLPKPLSESEVERLLGAPAHDTAKGLRDRALLELLYGSGLRISEACSLRFGGLDLSNDLGPHVRVRGKGSKDRSVPVSQAFLTALATYLRVREGANGPKDPIFLGREKAQSVSPLTLQVNLKRYLATAGLDPDYTPHKLRHSFPRTCSRTALISG